MEERTGEVGAAKPALSYLICATPRSGSTLLCVALDGTGIAGHPAEHFEVLIETGRPRQPRDCFQRSNDPEVWALLDDPDFREVLGEYGRRYTEHPTVRDPAWRQPDFEGLVREALRGGATENGVFGTKIMWAYFRDFVRLARRTPGLEGIRPCDVPAAVLPNLGRYVWIRRRDTTRQAVSLWKAPPDPEVAWGLGGRGRWGRSALQLRRRRPPQAANRRTQRRLAGLFRRVRRGAPRGCLRGSGR